MHLNEWRYQRKPLCHLLLRRGGGQKLLERISLQKSVRERRNEKLLKNPKNVVQPEVEQHHLNVDDPHSSSQACYTNETRTSQIPDNIVLGNHEAS
jgi:hypothetical protein